MCIPFKIHMSTASQHCTQQPQCIHRSASIPTLMIQEHTRALQTQILLSSLSACEFSSKPNTVKLYPPLSAWVLSSEPVKNSISIMSSPASHPLYHNVSSPTSLNTQRSSHPPYQHVGKPGTDKLTLPISIWALQQVTLCIKMWVLQQAWTHWFSLSSLSPCELLHVKMWAPASLNTVALSTLFRIHHHSLYT